jgi:hypothetical protein
MQERVFVLGVPVQAANGITRRVVAARQKLTRLRQVRVDRKNLSAV